jgi:hypothetical protein
MIINKTNDFEKVAKVQTALCELLQADKNAIKQTQILRIPYTYNVKGKTKMVKIIKLFDKATIKPYDIETLHKRFCTAKWEESQNNKDMNTKFIMNTLKLPACVNEILVNGSNVGNRNADLQKIVVALRMRNKKLNEIKYLVTEWNTKNEEPLSESELNYQTQYIFENLKTASYSCKECPSSQECWNKIESDFQYIEGEETIIMPDKNAKDLKHKNKKGSKMMNGNELLI